MVTRKQIEDVFDYYEVDSGIKNVYGDWAVSNGGDIVNISTKYPIYTPQLAQGKESWLSHLREKTWFDLQTESDFLHAFDDAII